MRSRKWLVGLLAVLVGAFALGTAVEAQGVIAKVIVKQTNGAPIPGEVVTIDNVVPVKTAITDSNGVAAFEIENKYLGYSDTFNISYTINIKETGKKQIGQFAVSSNARKVVFPFTVPNPTTAVTPPTGTAAQGLIGKIIVLQKDGKTPLSGATVTINNTTPIKTATTDKDGAAIFTIEDNYLKSGACGNSFNAKFTVKVKGVGSLQGGNFIFSTNEKTYHFSLPTTTTNLVGNCTSYRINFASDKNEGAGNMPNGWVPKPGTGITTTIQGYDPQYNKIPGSSFTQTITTQGNRINYAEFKNIPYGKYTVEISVAGNTYDVPQEDKPSATPKGYCVISTSSDFLNLLLISK